MSTLTEIEISMKKNTAERLQEISQKSGLEIGEVIDQLISKNSPTDPDEACSLAFHNILMLTSELTPDTSKETICKLILHFFLFFPFDDVCNFVVEREALRQALEEKLHSMSPARKAAFFKKFIPHPIFEYIKDEFLS